MVHTFLILDRHPIAFNPTTRQDKSQIEPKDQLPPFPIWSCMVQSTLDFCRMGWDLSNESISVLVAGKEPVVLNNSKQKNMNRLQQQFCNVQPREKYNTDRLQLSIEAALNSSMEQSPMGHRRCQLVLLLLSKNDEGKPFEFQNNENESSKDLRLMLYKATDKFKNLDHVQVDVLYLYPHSNQLPENIINRQVSKKVTLSIHFIPNGQNDLRVAMANLAQAKYNIGVLNISNIPMKSSEHTQSTHTVSLYYKLSGYHLINKKESVMKIHDPSYSNSKQMNLVYLKRSKRTIQDSEWCICRHNVLPTKVRDLPTEVYIEMTMKGSISYLMTPETSHDSRWTHVLMAENNVIHLYCLNNALQTQFSKAVEDTQDLVEVKSEGQKRPIGLSQEFDTTLLKPNLHADLASFTRTIQTNPAYHLVSIQPTRHGIALSTPKCIEKATRKKNPEKIKPTQIKLERPTQIKSEIKSEIDQAWNQVQKYQDMTLREREDAAQGIMVEGTKVNSNFRGRRNAPKQIPTIQKYPDPSLAIPYLNPIPPTLDERASEEKKEMEKLGEPGNLLWLYWMNERKSQKEEGILKYKKAKKEFEGRVAQPGEKGETIE